jgi:hypothetical protein
MTRDDVIRITEQVLEGLSIDMLRPDFTMPNERTIVLKYNGCEISRTSFDVVQQREYEG